MSQVTANDAGQCSVPISLFREALGQLAAGVSIIATELDGDRRGVTATAVCSVTDAPGTILVCINRNTGTGKMIADTKRFSVNVLGSHQEEVAMVFAGAGGVQGDERFAHGEWLVDRETGLPVLASALVNLACEVSHVHSTSTHDVFFGEVVTASTRKADPLIYFRQAFCDAAPKAA